MRPLLGALGLFVGTVALVHSGGGERAWTDFFKASMISVRSRR